MQKNIIMELLGNEGDTNDSEDLIYEKLIKFLYLNVVLSTKNDWSQIDELRIARSKKTCYVLDK